jgi:hypothetical protein
MSLAVRKRNHSRSAIETALLEFLSGSARTRIVSADSRLRHCGAEQMRCRTSFTAAVDSASLIRSQKSAKWSFSRFGRILFSVTY